MIVAITGGTGFIGAEMVKRHLAAGDEVRVLSRKPRLEGAHKAANLVWCTGDLADPGVDLSSFVTGASVLYHCAGELKDVSRMHAVHVEGTERLVRAAAGKVGRWVQLSSVGAYGPRRAGNVTEDTSATPVGPYEVSKTLSDDIVIEAASAGAFQLCVLRPSNVIGETMPNRSLFQLLAAIQRGMFVYIGSPGAVASYIHVDNVAEALELCGRAVGKGDAIYNLSQQCSFEEFVSIVCDELQCAPPRVRLPENFARLLAWILSPIPGFPLTAARIDALTTRAVYASDKIHRDLGYVPTVSIEQAIRRLAAAWKNA